MMLTCSTDWSDLAAWVQAIFSIVAIGVAIWIPRRDRDDRRRQEFQSQLAALLAIAKRAETTINRLRDKSKAGAVNRDLVGWLRDEIAAVSAIADGVDLTRLMRPALVNALVEIQEACRTAKRRFRYTTATKTAKGRSAIPVPQDRFDDPSLRIQRAITALENVLTTI